MHAGVCSDLPVPTNGMITYSDGSTNNRPVDTSATHSCNNGTLSLEGIQGSVVMVGSGADQLPCVNVSESIHACTPGMEYDINVSF